MRQGFIDSAKRFVEEIDEIDVATIWSAVEPEWWLDMMEIKRKCLDAIEKYKK